MTEIALEPEIYCPIVDDTGNYVDKVPRNILSLGLRCPCSVRKDKSYISYAAFSTHIKTKTHIKWLETMNANKQNHYEENVRLTETVNAQKLIIAKMEKEIQTKIFTIDILSQQLAALMNGGGVSVPPQTATANIDLLDF